MGGTNLPGNHKLLNSISYDNAAKGIDSNSCPDVKVYSSTSYNNEGYNVALYTGNKSAVTDYAADGVISFRKGTDGKEQLTLQSQSSRRAGLRASTPPLLRPGTQTAASICTACSC